MKNVLRKALALFDSPITAYICAIIPFCYILALHVTVKAFEYDRSLIGFEQVKSICCSLNPIVDEELLWLED